MNSTQSHPSGCLCWRPSCLFFSVSSYTTECPPTDSSFTLVFEIWSIRMLFVFSPQELCLWKTTRKRKLPWTLNLSNLFLGQCTCVITNFTQRSDNERELFFWPQFPQALAEMLESDDKFGFIVMDGNGALFGTLSGSTREILHKFSVELPKKHGRGGQSALRFARLRLEKRHNYVRKVAELATQCFITADRVWLIFLFIKYPFCSSQMSLGLCLLDLPISRMTWQHLICLTSVSLPLWWKLLMLPTEAKMASIRSFCKRVAFSYSPSSGCRAEWWLPCRGEVHPREETHQQIFWWNFKRYQLHLSLQWLQFWSPPKFSKLEGLVIGGVRILGLKIGLNVTQLAPFLDSTV